MYYSQLYYKHRQCNNIISTTIVPILCDCAIVATHKGWRLDSVPVWNAYHRQKLMTKASITSTPATQHPTYIAILQTGNTVGTCADTH